MPDGKQPSTYNQEARPDTVALFVSDVHLQPTMPHTTQAFLGFLQRHAANARQLYLLGDLFEAWAGDDDIPAGYNQLIVDALREVHQAGVQLFWIAGNRDFLIGREFAAATGAILLPDPSVINLGGREIALAHGDAQCTDDTDYMRFRRMVREPSWQQEFLGMPLAQRKTIIAQMRNGSRDAQREKSYDIMDVNPAAIDALFDATGTATLIHGHTHRPGCHCHASAHGPRIRYVLPDWDCDNETGAANATPRGGWIAAATDGSLKRISLDGTPAPDS